VSPDGRTIAIEDNDGNTVVEDAATARRIGVLHADIIAFGPDGSLLTEAGGTLTGSHDGIDVRDSQTLKVARMIALPWSVRGTDTVIAGVTFAEHEPRMAVLVARQQDTPQGPVTLTNSVIQYDYKTGQVTVAIGRIVIGDDKQPHLGKPTDVKRFDIHSKEQISVGLKAPGPRFRVEVTITPTFVPAQLSSDQTDRRQLGAKVSYVFLPPRKATHK
jgi:hypothetical protein